MKIWTEAYRPFLMGGDVNGPIGTDISVGEKMDLGKGIFGFVVTNPNTGKTHVVEEKSGAFVGTSLEMVRQDILDCDDIKVMKKQIKEAKKRSTKVDVLEPETFWEHFRG